MPEAIEVLKCDICQKPIMPGDPYEELYDVVFCEGCYHEATIDTTKLNTDILSHDCDSK